ncbi:MAG TPA: nuclear transport factor 2 family protein [Candidatus Acidoferrales bacterium]|jgi:hypothetical protein|nr:nuclear transport factor 2 family protein [Candidatus Acidoferrales bacterium]
MSTSTLTGPKFSAAFGTGWIEAWNSRELERILKHYARDVEFTSPFVSQLLGGDENTIRGIAMLRVYFHRALNAYPDLHFKLRRVYTGNRSLVIEYHSVAGRLAAETMEFNDSGLIMRVNAHYTAAKPKPVRRR